MSPEAASPAFPDRLIHPLPKRRLRDRLSSDAADSIKYPPDQTPGAPLFYYPYSLKQDAVPAERPIFTGQASPAVLAVKPTPATAVASTPGARQVPAADRTTQRPAQARRSSAETEISVAARTTRAINRSARPAQPLHTPTAQTYWNAPSAALAADGFDSFEYTSNTKKRKIPSAGDTSHTGSYSSTSFRSTASVSSNSSFDSLACSPPSPVDVKPASFSTSTPLGISGPGRGRYGRTQRYPVPASSRNIFLTPASRNVLDGHRKQQIPRPGQVDTTSNSGIISNAIANAERRGSIGEESSGSIDQLQETDSYPQGSLQFTFTCSSKVPGNLLWAGSDPKAASGSTYWQHDQAQSRMRGGQGVMHPTMRYQSVSETSNGSSVSGKLSKGAGRTKQQLEKDKESIKIRQELRKQMRDRRRNQQELNATRPTPEGDIYICPFCEYESITGRKPRLIYQFEKKERNKRLEIERRQREQRNKEKARNRNRKGRKASKASAAVTGSNTQQGSIADEQPYDDTHDDNGQGTIDDDEYEDDDGAGEADDYGETG
ncbi:hypothetical protein SEUCBS139899_006139 [Sporothrix eucalyptigena]